MSRLNYLMCVFYHSLLEGKLQVNCNDLYSHMDVITGA